MNNIERIRREQGFNQTELAKRCEVTQGMISDYENGTIPTLKVAVRIAKVLGVTIEELFPENELTKDSAA